MATTSSPTPPPAIHVPRVYASDDERAGISPTGTRTPPAREGDASPVSVQSGVSLGVPTEVFNFKALSYTHTGVAAAQTFWTDAGTQNRKVSRLLMAPGSSNYAEARRGRTNDLAESQAMLIMGYNPEGKLYKAYKAMSHFSRDHTTLITRSPAKLLNLVGTSDVPFFGHAHNLANYTSAALGLTLSAVLNLALGVTGIRYLARNHFPALMVAISALNAAVIGVSRLVGVPLSLVAQGAVLGGAIAGGVIAAVFYGLFQACRGIKYAIQHPREAAQFMLKAGKAVLKHGYSLAGVVTNTVAKLLIKPALSATTGVLSAIGLGAIPRGINRGANYLGEKLSIRAVSRFHNNATADWAKTANKGVQIGADYFNRFLGVVTQGVTAIPVAVLNVVLGAVPRLAGMGISSLRLDTLRDKKMLRELVVEVQNLKSKGRRRRLNGKEETTKAALMLDIARLKHKEAKLAKSAEMSVSERVILSSKPMRRVIAMLIGKNYYLSATAGKSGSQKTGVPEALQLATGLGKTRKMRALEAEIARSKGTLDRRLARMGASAKSSTEVTRETLRQAAGINLVRSSSEGSLASGDDSSASLTPKPGRSAFHPTGGALAMHLRATARPVSEDDMFDVDDVAPPKMVPGPGRLPVRADNLHGDMSDTDTSGFDVDVALGGETSEGSSSN